jgi:hypothetical protein
MPHSPARWPPYGRPETSRLLKVNHNMLHVHLKMRLGGCAAPSQHTDADTGVRGWQESSTPLQYGRSSLPDFGVYIQGDLKAVIHGQARRVLKTTFFGYRDL